MSEEINSKGVEDLPKNLDNVDGAAELVKKIDKMIKNNKKQYFDASLPSRYNFQKT